jgi:hypothetical protein
VVIFERRNERGFMGCDGRGCEVIVTHAADPRALPPQAALAAKLIATAERYIASIK